VCDEPVRLVLNQAIAIVPEEKQTMEFIRRTVAILSVVIVAGLALPAAGQSAHPAAAIGKISDLGYANVREAPYSAASDGKTDDTQAFQKALDEVGAAGGGIVFVPTGAYMIKTHLTIPAGTSLSGVGRAPLAYNPKSPGSTLLAVEGAGSAEGIPFITLRGLNATLEGITVLYPEQVIVEKPVPYPWTVRGDGENVSIINVLLANPYQGVDFGTHPSARHFVRGLYGQPLFKGLWVDQCYDIGRIQDVHFWPFWSQDKRIVDFTTTNGIAFILQRTDWEVVEDIFAWGYHVGIEFSASPYGGMNGQMTDIDLDNVNIGLDVSATQPCAVLVSNLNIANAGAGTDHVGIWGRKSGAEAELSVRGASFWGSLKQMLRWENSGSVSLADSRLMYQNVQLPMMEILAGRALIHDNFFRPYPQKHADDSRSHPPVPARRPATLTAVRIGPGVDNVMVHGNQLRGNRIVNEAGTRALVANNQP
jgi:hypothetical protein